MASHRLQATEGLTDFAALEEAGSRMERQGGGDGVPDHEDEAHAAELVAKTEAALAPGVPLSREPAAQLHADRRLVTAIVAEGLKGRLHRETELALFEYALPVLKYLIMTGEIASRCRRLGRPVDSYLATLYELTEDERESLAIDMIADAIPVFNRRVFEDRHWSPNGGATLTTYFVNACIGQFSSLYRRWCRLHRRDVPFGLEPEVNGASAFGNPEVQALVSDEVAHVLKEIPDDRLKQVLVLRAMGYSHAMASELAGLTSKAAEGRLTRLRQRIKEKERPVSKKDVPGEGEAM